MDLFTLTAKLNLDTSDYETKIKDITEQAKTDGTTLSEKLTPSVGAGTGGGTGGTGGGTGGTGGGTTTGFGTSVRALLTSELVQQGADLVLDAAKESINTASDLKEVQNVVDQTFGSSANQINRWAESQAGAYGLSELQAKQYAGYLGSIFQSSGIGQEQSAEMAMNLAGLAGDIASFYNTGIDEAYEKIRSGISGTSIEPLQGLGINLSAGNLEEYSGMSIQDMSEMEKIQTRYNYLMDKTMTVQGDYMRTSDEYANSQRTLENNLEKLSVSFGEKLLPVMQAGTNAANSFFDAIYSETADETLNGIDIAAQNTSESIESTAERARAMVSVLEDYGDKSALTAEQQGQWNTVAGELIRSIPELGGMLDLQTGKIEGGTDALYENISAWESAGKTAAETSALEAKQNMLADISEEIAREQGLLDVSEKQLAQNQQAVIDLGTQVAQTLGKEFDGTAESARELILSNAGWYTALQKGLTEADIVEILSPYDQADEAITTHKENIASLQTEYDTVEQSIEEDSTALSESVSTMETDVTSSFGNVGSAFDTLVSDLDQGETAYANAYNTGIGAANGLLDAYPSWASALSRYKFTPTILETSKTYGPMEESDTIAGGVGSAVSSALNGAAVLMDGERVGQLVLPTVSKGIEQQSRQYRYTT